MGLGTGGFKANISPLIAEQQRLNRPFISQTKSGERVVVDPTLTTSRIYMVRFLLQVVNQHDGLFLLVFLFLCQRWRDGWPDLHDVC